MPRSKRSRRPVHRRSRLWIVAVAGACLVAYLYYRPVRAYVSASHQLEQRKAEVKALAREKGQLERRLALSGTGQTLLQAARLRAAGRAAVRRPRCEGVARRARPVGRRPLASRQWARTTIGLSWRDSS